jgi:Fe-S-cluster-containing dehydrogenase component
MAKCAICLDRIDRGGKLDDICVLGLSLFYS